MAKRYPELLVPNDGKRLEALVAFIEQTLGPTGVKVERNEKIYAEGAQLAELDVIVTGRFGTTDFRWLIECRDRPSEGAAAVSWIEQLSARKGIHGFHKVTAVSTTGFSAAAQEIATRTGVELREVAALDSASFDWLGLECIDHEENFHKLDVAHILIDPSESPEGQAAVTEILKRNQEPILRAALNDVITSNIEAFATAMKAANPSPFDGLVFNGPSRHVDVMVLYPTEDRFVIDTRLGAVPVQAIRFIGYVALRSKLVPITGSSVYRGLAGEVISETVTFAPMDVMGKKITFEMHRINENGQTFLAIGSTESPSDRQQDSSLGKSGDADFQIRIQGGKKKYDIRLVPRLHIGPPSVMDGNDEALMIVPISPELLADYECDEPHAFVEKVVSDVLNLIPIKPSDAEAETFRESLFNWINAHRAAAALRDHE